MVEVAGQRRPGPSLLGHQGEAASRAHQRAESSTKIERRDVTTVEDNVQAALSDMTSAPIQHLGRRGISVTELMRRAVALDAVVFDPDHPTREIVLRDGDAATERILHPL